MTVVCVSGGIMAADSHVFSGGTHWEGAFPKITRGPKGLIGVAGNCTDCYLISQWWAVGAEGGIPGLLQGRDGIAALILMNDGSMWFMDERLKPYPTREPAVTGQPDASTFCEGAMWAGASAEEAVRLAIRHTTSAGGDVQVERLEQTQHCTMIDPEYLLGRNRAVVDGI